MIAVKEKHFQSIKADASLYNGQPTTNRVKKPSSLGLCRGAKEEGKSQPTDTGAKCHSVGVTSGTPSIPKNKDWVSVRNVHKHNKQWSVLRVSYGRIFKAKTLVIGKGYKISKWYKYSIARFANSRLDSDFLRVNICELLVSKNGEIQNYK